MNPALLALLTLAALAVVFALVYLIARRLDNYGVVDVAWSYAFGAVAIAYAAGGSGWAPRRWLVAGLVLAWSVRLGTHLGRRVWRHHPVEDTRYQALRETWRENFGAKMFGFFQLQALSVVLLALPLLLAVGNTASALHPLEFVALGLWLVALAGETLADAQLAAFRRAPGASGSVCRRGLWRFSRHPNYFFEWLGWVALALFALPSPWGWVGFVSPLLMLYLLLRVTGIPLTESRSIRSKGDAYREYQRTTSAFFPWRPRRGAPA